jgi:hypothetical protein
MHAKCRRFGNREDDREFREAGDESACEVHTRDVPRRAFARARSERRARALRISDARCVRGAVRSVMTLRRRNMA